MRDLAARQALRLTTASVVALAPGPAFAHNCGNLSDCYQIPMAAALAGLGISVLVFFLPELLALSRARSALQDLSDIIDNARERLQTATTAGAIDEAASALLEGLIRKGPAVPTAGGFAWGMSESYAEQYALENWGPSWSPLAGEAVHLMNIGVQVAHGNVHGALADATLHTSKRLIEAGHSAFKFYEEYNAAKDAGARAEAAQALLDLRAAYRSTGDPDTRRILLAQIETVSRAAYGEQFARTAVERLETVTTQQATGNEQISRPLDPATRPEQPAPVFQPAPWENRLPLFPQDTNGTISQGYGWWDLYGETDFHEGIDVVVPAGTEVRSVTGGEVAVVRNSDNPAMTGIVIRNGNMTYTYWHVTPASNLTSGTSVSTGTPIGQVAAWHHPDGRDRTHLHYAVHRPPEDALGLRSDLNSQSPL